MMKVIVSFCVLVTLFSLVKAINEDLFPLCGVSKADRIIGGTDAQKGAWPWMAAISVNNKFICGGSIITKDLILTSAQCDHRSNNISVTDHEVRVGSLMHNEGGQVYIVDRIVKHPNFSSTGNLKNDLALFRLAIPIVKFTNTVGPICFPPVELAGSVATVIGWGKGKNGQYSSTLKQVNVTLVDLATCKKQHENITQINPITYTQYCAGGNGKDISVGDYGGPLMKSFTTADGITEWFAIGLASFGVNNKAKPSVYTNVAEYFYWIGAEIERLYEPTLPKVCGTNNVEARIMGGTNAKTGNWPWMAAIFINGSFVCGGTIITKNIVLTSARCYDKNTDVTDHTVRVGSLKVNEGGQVYTVSKVKIHPKFNTSGKIKNDIALFRLALPILEFNKTVSPICLPVLPANKPQGVITGWGLGGNGTFSQTLQQLNVTMVDLSECNNDYVNEQAAPITDTQFCAGGFRQNSCPGDYGGPLMMYFKDASGTVIWTLDAVSSFGSSQGCSKGVPSVYTNVAKYFHWMFGAFDEIYQA